MNWKDKRVFITGGTGFIGSHLAKRLRSLGAKVGLFIHKSQSPLDCFKVIGDLSLKSTPAFLSSSFSHFNPEFVFHLAAQPLVQVAMKDSLETLRINIDGTYNLLDACVGLESLKAFVHVSTDKVYGDVDRAVREDDELHGVSHPYNASKLCGDVIAQMYAKSFGVPVVIARSGNVYGGGDKSPDRLIPETIRSTLKGERTVIRSDGTLERDYVFVEDIVDGYLVLAEKMSLGDTKKGLAVNLGARESMSVLEVVHEILGKMRRVDLSPEITDTAKFEIPYQHLNWGLAKSMGWSPKTSFSDGLDKTIAWYSENQ